MQTLKKTILFLTVAGIGFTSCKKEEAVSKKETIAKKWLLTEYKIDGNSFPATMFNNSHITFDAAGTFTYKLIVDSTNGTWAFNSNETEITLTKANSSTQLLSLKELTASSLKANTYINDSVLIEMAFTP